MNLGQKTMSLPLGLPHHLRSQQDHESQTMSFNLNEFNALRANLLTGLQGMDNFNTDPGLPFRAGGPSFYSAPVPSTQSASAAAAAAAAAKHRAQRFPRPDNVSRPPGVIDPTVQQAMQSPSNLAILEKAHAQLMRFLRGPEAEATLISPNSYERLLLHRLISFYNCSSDNLAKGSCEVWVRKPEGYDVQNCSQELQRQMMIAKESFNMSRSGWVGEDAGGAAAGGTPRSEPLPHAAYSMAAAMAAAPAVRYQTVLVPVPVGPTGAPLSAVNPHAHPHPNAYAAALGPPPAPALPAGIYGDAGAGAGGLLGGGGGMAPTALYTGAEVAALLAQGQMLAQAQAQAQVAQAQVQAQAQARMNSAAAGGYFPNAPVTAADPSLGFLPSLASGGMEFFRG